VSTATGEAFRCVKFSHFSPALFHLRLVYLPARVVCRFLSPSIWIVQCLMAKLASAHASLACSSSREPYPECWVLFSFAASSSDLDDSSVPRRLSYSSKAVGCSTTLWLQLLRWSPFARVGTTRHRHGPPLCVVCQLPGSFAISAYVWLFLANFTPVLNCLQSCWHPVSSIDTSWAYRAILPSPTWITSLFLPYPPTLPSGTLHARAAWLALPCCVWPWRVSIFPLFITSAAELERVAALMASIHDIPCPAVPAALFCFSLQFTTHWQPSVVLASSSATSGCL
jgi:hypothetical protein